MKTHNDWDSCGWWTMRYDPFSNVAGSKKMTHPHEIGPPNHNCSMLAGPLVRTVDHWYVQWYVSACAQCKKTRSAEFAHFKFTVLGFYPKKHEVLKLPKSRGTRAPVPSTWTAWRKEEQEYKASSNQVSKHQAYQMWRKSELCLCFKE